MNATAFANIRCANINTGRATLYFTLVGLAAAFALASICALPQVLGAMGFGSSCIEGVGDMAGPHRTLLLYLSGVNLAIGGVMLWFEQQRVHESFTTNMAAPVTIRVVTFLALTLGEVLLLAGNSCA
jgi:mercuric ion transport protein